ncbi:hypothetical protein J2S28_001649 [Rhizobium sp. SLBN-94]|nr:hypothetical protein [Rhizobium sp. SLBN-94]
MAEITQDPLIKIIGFKTSYERLPVRSTKFDDEVDAKGFKLDAKGKRVMDNMEVDWVCYAPAHSPINTQNWERVKHLEVTDFMLQGDITEKLRSMKVRWDQIEPAYKAWKAGHEVPVDGTPLSAWPGITPDKAEVLRRYGIRTVEEVSRLVESQLERIQLPGMRDMRRSAVLFLENKGAAESAARETERDNEIANLKAQLAENNDRLTAAMELLEQQTKPDAGEDDVDAIRAELDDLGVKYHHKAGLNTLKALLAEHQQKAA